MVVDGAAWMWREPILPREAVPKASRGVESQSRGVGTASKL
jgi:2,4-dienoyl-CoA reductase [(3E)-enoyl-CoA-producing], peroxisomal